jgi:hypothetical protein
MTVGGTLFGLTALLEFAVNGAVVFVCADAHNPLIR